MKNSIIKKSILLASLALGLSLAQTVLGAGCIDVPVPLKMGDGEVVGATTTDIYKLQSYLGRGKFMSLQENNGFFDKMTKTALTSFQIARGLPASGEVDIATRNKLISLTCVTSDDRIALIADAFIARNPNPATLAEWYPNSVIMISLENVYKATNKIKYYDYLRKYIDSKVWFDPTISDWRFRSGWGSGMYENNLAIRPLLFLYEKTGSIKYLNAAKNLSAKNYWNMPKQASGLRATRDTLYLDAIYMFGPALGQLAKDKASTTEFDELADQFIIYANKLQDQTTGLMGHAWIKTSTGEIVNRVNWSRANGWYIMAVVDFLDYLPANHPKRAAIIESLNKMVAGLAKVQDPNTGLWYQVLNEGSRAGNWYESSGSAMFVYSIQKAIEKGYVGGAYQMVVDSGLKGIRSMTYMNNGKVVLQNICKGLSPAWVAANMNFEYYTNSSLIQEDDPHGVGAFLLAENQVKN